MERLRKSARYDVTENIRFHCIIGKNEAVLGIFIEPDPHGDGKGTHAHFHTTLGCPNKKVVEIPEPDRCQITNTTCPLIAPFGSYERNPDLRKLEYAHNIIRMMAYVEFYGSQLVNGLLTNKELPPAQGNLRMEELSRIMVISDLIDTETFQRLNKLRKVRNKLAHHPKKYLDFSEKELFALSMDAQDLSNTVRKLLSSLEKGSEATN